MPKPCLIWAGPFDDKGFPRFIHAGENYSAIRVAWFLGGIEPPRDHEIVHVCPRLTCVEPSHLEVGEPNLRAFKPIPLAMLNSEDRFWGSAA